MKHSFYGLLLALISLSTWAAPALRVGDLLLQPLNCWACNLIEAEENSIYSHLAVVVSERPYMVAEAFGPVKVVPIGQFLSKTENGQKVGVLRFKDRHVLEQFNYRRGEFKKHLATFEGKPFDKMFLWNNFDDRGNELYYCSEFVTKLLEPFLQIKLPLKRMHFNVNRSHWETYFGGKVPDGEWGNSPADFHRSSDFDFLGEL